MRTFLCLAAIAAVIPACASQGTNSGPIAAPTAPRHVSALSNGQDIFQTGKDAYGTQIIAQRKPLKSSCAACHRPNGMGGIQFPNGPMSADLRHKSLVIDQKPPYTLALVERAISKGIDNQGKPLDPVMPRWKLSKRDLHDVASYVLTLK